MQRGSEEAPRRRRGTRTLRSHLTEEHEHAHVELQQPGDAERSPLGAAQRVEQELPAQRALPLLSPHVDLLLAVSERAVLPVLALLTLLHLCASQEKRMFNATETHFLQYFTFLTCSTQTYLYRVQRPPGSCSVQAVVGSSST